MRYEDFEEGHEVWASILWYSWKPAQTGVIEFSMSEYWIFKGVIIEKDLHTFSLVGKPVLLKLFHIEFPIEGTAKYYKWLDPEFCHDTEKEAYEEIKILYTKQMDICTKYCQDQIDLINTRICEIDKKIKQRFS